VQVLVPPQATMDVAARTAPVMLIKNNGLSMISSSSLRPRRRRSPRRGRECTPGAS
jgi:hypothetical protein